MTFFKWTTEVWQIRADEAWGRKSERGCRQGFVVSGQEGVGSNFTICTFLIHLEIIRRSPEEEYMSSVLFSTVLHKESVQEENIVKARNFCFTRFFRALDLKTDTLLL